LVTAVEGGSAAPAAAARYGTILLDNEVGPVVDELSINAHDRSAKGNLGFIEEGLLEFGNGHLHEQG